MPRLRALLLLFAYRLFAQRYSMHVAKTDAEKKAVFSFSHQIYREEYNYPFEKSQHDNLIYDEDDYQENSIILYSGALDNITATIRLVIWDSKSVPQSMREKYDLDDKFLSEVDSICEINY